MSNMIEQNRKRKGWSQADLATYLGVSQQAVSNWEGGISCPSPVMLKKIADIFKLDKSVLKNKLENLASYKRPKPNRLDLSLLGYKDFENFILELIKGLYETVDRHACSWGGQGEKQDGADLVLKKCGKFEMVIQCKNRKKFGPSELNATVAVVDDGFFNADKYVLALGRPASLSIKKEIGKYKKWEAWDTETISDKIYYDLSKDKAQLLMDRYLPGIASSFLGISGSYTPWLLPEDAFEYKGWSQMTNHKHDFVGDRPKEMLEAIVGDLQDSEKVIGIIDGRAGSGKSRFAKEVMEKMQKDKFAVRVLKDNASVRREDFELLPSGDLLLLIIDDAHSRSDLKQIISIAREKNERMKILLTVRTDFKNLLLQELGQLQLYEEKNIVQRTLKDMKLLEMKNMLKSIAAEGLSENTFRQIAEISYDYPAIGVIAINLINNGDLEEKSVYSGDLYSKIAKRVKTLISADWTKERTKVLRAIALLQPFDSSGDEFTQLLAQFTELDFDEVKFHLDELEAEGIIMRRGSVLRIVPALLGDIILEEACASLYSTDSIKYIDRIGKVFKGLPFQHALINVSRVEGRFRAASARQSPPADMLWDYLKDGSQFTNEEELYQLLGSMEQVAILQPKRTLEFVEWLQKNHRTKIIQPPYSHLKKMLPAILKRIAYDPRFFKRSAGLLKLIHEEYGEDFNSDPNNALSVLIELAKYKHFKPFVFNQKLLELCEEWLEQDNKKQRHYVLDILEEFLITNYKDISSEAGSNVVRLYSGVMPVQPIGEIREKAVQLLLQEISSEDIKRSTHALKVLCSGWYYAPRSKSSKDSSLLEWESIFAEEIFQLVKLIKEEKLDPLFFIVIQQAFSKRVSGSRDIDKAVKALVSLIPDNLLYHISASLYGNEQCINVVVEQPFMWRQLNYSEKQKLFNEGVADLARKVLGEFEVSELVLLLEKRIVLQNIVFSNELANGLISELVREQPELAPAIFGHIKKVPASPLNSALSIVMSAFAVINPDKALCLAEDLIGLGTKSAAKASVHALQEIVRNKDKLSVREWKLISKCSINSEVEVREQVLEVARVLSSSNMSEAVDILMGVRVDDDQKLVEEWCMALGVYGYVSWDNLQKAQKEEVRQVLEKCNSVDGYQISSLWNLILEKDTLLALGVFLKRIEVCATKDNQHKRDDNTYEAIPYSWTYSCFEVNYDVIRRLPKKDLLNYIFNWMINKTDLGWQIRYMGAYVFNLMAVQYEVKDGEGFYISEATEILIEALKSDCPKQFEVVCAILRRSPKGFAWQNKDFVVQVLEIADSMDEHRLKKVVGALHEAAYSISKHSSTRIFPEDEKQLKEATRIQETLGPTTLAYKFYKILKEEAERNIKNSSDDDTYNSQVAGW